jgi:hypothetical protein
LLSVAVYIFTGMFTKPKERDPFHMLLMGAPLFVLVWFPSS